MGTITRQRTIHAPSELVWDVMTDPELYAAVAPNLAEVEIIEGHGEGMIRRCEDVDGNSWTESCHRWETGRSFGVTVDVENSDFHRRLFSRFEGVWRLTERGDEVIVEIEFDYDTRYGPVGTLISKYFEYRGPGLVEAILDGWEAEIETRLERNATISHRATPSGSGSEQPSELPR